MTDELEPIAETPETTTEQAPQETEKAVEDIKEEVDKRDDAILVELRGLREDIRAQTEHHIRHLESHSMAITPAAPPTNEPEKENLPDEPVSLSIDEPKDLPKEKDKEHKKSRKFGKRGRRV